jgi:phage regulator Rha-like protein
MTEIVVNKTMSSREIAELTGKQHGHVMRDIREMLISIHGAEDAPRFGGIYLDAYKREKPMFILPEDECLTLCAGYDAKARFAIVKEWRMFREGGLSLPESRESNSMGNEIYRLICEKFEKSPRYFVMHQGVNRAAFDLKQGAIDYAKLNGEQRALKGKVLRFWLKEFEKSLASHSAANVVSYAEFNTKRTALLASQLVSASTNRLEHVA